MISTKKEATREHCSRVASDEGSSVNDQGTQGSGIR
jgi:hypothetical protein